MIIQDGRLVETITIQMADHNNYTIKMADK